MINSSDQIRFKISVVIPNFNGMRWLPGCLKALFDQEFKDFSVILVDNNSSDNSVDWIKKNYPLVEILSLDYNSGFASAVNYGINSSQSEYVVLINTDTVPKKNWLLKLVEIMDDCGQEIGCLSSKMLNMQNPETIENAGDIFTFQGAAIKRGHGLPANNYSKVEEILSPCAGAAFYRRSFLEESGGFDELFFAYLEDIDIGLRGRILGYRYLFVPEAEILHYGHGGGLPHAQYVRYITRNRLLVFLKNIPFKLLLKHLPSFLYGQFYFLVAYR
ncbi:MAG: glycosyltransferase family 2 protein, partial [Candidatus Theseobacter exili]|nr:glycosyltransferase family 2 protein [Candidatus Theseobacter exili]